LVATWDTALRSDASLSLAIFNNLGRFMLLNTLLFFLAFLLLKNHVVVEYRKSHHHFIRQRLFDQILIDIFGFDWFLENFRADWLWFSLLSLVN
jgi:hypothetical protein